MVAKAEIKEPKMKNISISVFFPAYNDEKTIPGLVNDAISVLKPITDDYEVIVIDDGSPDNVGRIADEMASRDSHIMVVHHEKNRGYGGALKSGFRAATKEYIAYTDGDAQYDVKELSKFLEYCQDYDVVNGYKFKRGDALYRKVLGKAYHHLAKIMFGLRVRDADCDFRMFKRQVIENTPLYCDEGFICVEMMHKISKGNYKIKEIPVNHYPRKYGSSQFFNFRRVSKTLYNFTVGWWNLVVMKKDK